jgi:hypothetical protein
MADSSRYRLINFYGGRILESREMMELQTIERGVDANGNPVAFDLDGIYRPGSTMNVTASVTGLTVTLGATNPALPMLLFIRGRWETLRNSDITPITLSAGQTHIYMNYAIRQVTSTEDPSLVDTTTGQPTADMGELDFNLSNVDTSAVALASNQFEKNTSPIILFTFTNNGSVLTPVVIDNVNSPALATKNISGLVHLSTNTSGGEALSSDDPAVANARTPLANSVVDASVRTPVAQSGQNADGSAVYDLSKDPGGISADKIIYQQVTERLSDFLSWMKAQITSAVTNLNNHIGHALGLGNTHPMPTAVQVGAAPLSHVNMPLGVSGSHPAAVSSDSGGFTVNESTASYPASPAFAVYRNGSFIGGTLHSGDYSASLLNAYVASPGGAPIRFSGPLQTLSNLCQVVIDHVNQKSHANPHGLTAADLGAGTTAGFAISLGSTGYIKLPSWMSGLMIQWAVGTTTIPRSTRMAFTENWKTSFPNSCFVVLPSMVLNSTVNANIQANWVYVQPGTNLSSVSLYADSIGDGEGNCAWHVFLIGIGY